MDKATDDAPAAGNGTPEPAPYDFDIDLDSDSTHARVVRLVGTGRRVLELGPATGYMSRIFRDRGCSVVAIELDPRMAGRASEYCERLVVGDLETLDLEDELGADRFDVIVAADVLEHLKDPLDALRRLRTFLAPGGFFVISLPNVAHGSVRLALLGGRFQYQAIGLLDRTHLRFFTRESIDQLLDEAELAAVEIHRQTLSIEASEVPYDREKVPDDVLQLLSADPESETYQFVIKAMPLEAPGLREVQRHMRELAHENARLQQVLQHREADLERLQPALAAAVDREGQLQARLVDAYDQLLQRDEQTQELRDELLRVRTRLQRITDSPPARAWAALRHQPVIRSVVASRTAGYQAALRQARAGSDRGDG